MIRAANFYLFDQALSIVFKPEEYSYKSAYFTVLVGENGSSKSRILSSLAFELTNYTGRKKISKSYFKCEVDAGALSKVIAIATSPFDKFPTAGPIIEHEWNPSIDKSSNYYYLGIRSKNGQGLKNSKRRVFEILQASILNNPDSKKYLAWQLCFQKLNLDRHIFIEWGEGDARSFFERQRGGFASGERKASMKFLISNSLEISKNKYIFSVDINSAAELKSLAGILHLERDGKVKVASIKISKTNSSKEQYDLFDGSSGELSLLMQGLGLSACLKDNSIILIDEPEISLHPNWQVEYVDYLKKLAESYTNCHFVIATHSPHILSGLSAKESGVLAIKRTESGGIKVQQLHSERGSWSIERLLLDIFGIQNAHNQEFESMVTSAVSLIADDKAKDRKSRLTALVQRFEQFELEPLDPLLELIADAKDVLDGLP